MLEWLIVGGGPLGVHVAAVLRERAGVASDALRILDPAPRLLDRWSHCAANVGMRHLRSTLVHHLAPRPDALWEFAARTLPSAASGFAPPYQHPSVGLFEAHSAEVAAPLSRLHLRGRATAIRPGSDHVRVETGGEALRARRVVLALGRTEWPDVPAWARGLPGVAHVFAPDFRLADVRGFRRAVVVGGGLSAVQCALALSARGPVTLLARHALRIQQFDSDSGWMGPRLLEGFWREPDPGARAEALRGARLRGTIPVEVAREFRRGRVDHRVVTDYVASPEGGAVRFDLGGDSVLADRVVLATGSRPGRAGGQLVDALAAELPVGPCGSPLTDAALRWHPRVHVVGALAELELGPAAANLPGARMAARRVADAA